MADVDVLKDISRLIEVIFEHKNETRLLDIKKIRLEYKSGYVLDKDEQIVYLAFVGCDRFQLDKVMPFLKKLAKLEGLHLSNNNIADITPLQSLGQLKHLVLRNNGIGSLAPLMSLVDLESLYVTDNHVADIAFLNNLKRLTRLGFDTVEINDITVVNHLPNLVELDLERVGLPDVAPLKNLTLLRRLWLLDNKIQDISPLEKLTNLETLQLGRNSIQDFSVLDHFKRLQFLWLLKTGIQNTLSLSGLSNLRTLGLGENNLDSASVLPLVHLKELQVLHLQDNMLTNISFLQGLENLEELYLHNNQISSIFPLKRLNKLKTLALNSNPIRRLPSWITDFNLDIKWEPNPFSRLENSICFFNNPLQYPPPEIVQAGKEAVGNYFVQLQEQEADHLFEAKLLILGEPGAGKTSMSRKLENVNNFLPGEEETTKGINVQQYYFDFVLPGTQEARKFRLNIWDFGGQEIYKATHRFFLTNRSVYALVADSRNEDTDFNYWLHIIEMFGGNSPLLIVLNEKHQRKRDIDISVMRQRFANILEVLDVDFAESDERRLNKIREMVKYCASNLPHIGIEVPARWVAIREAIESDERNTISLSEYVAICAASGITKTQSALVLSRYFHDVGVFLHFQDDVVLDKTIFLKPNWATNAVYKILDHELLNEKKGRFTKEDAIAIWHEDEYMFVRNELLRLMQKFLLTYEIGNTGEYIVPERLPSIQPEYILPIANTLQLRYKYDIFMPKGIISQLIVQLHRYIHNHSYVWRRGVVLQRENALAEIIESYDARTIRIRITGQNSRDFMTIIADYLDGINAQFEKMKVQKLIPCNCGECKSSEEPYFYSYQTLKRRMDRGVHHVECDISYRQVLVRSLIDDVVSPVEERNDMQNIVQQSFYSNSIVSEKNVHAVSRHSMAFHQALYLLFKDAFNRAELEAFLMFLPEGASITASLPGREASMQLYAREAVIGLRRFGLLNEEFFQRLEQERPARAVDIELVRQKWVLWQQVAK